MNRKRKNRGFIVLSSMTIIGGILLIVSLDIHLRSIKGLEEIMLTERSEETRALVDSCAEIVLEKISANMSYGGDEDIFIHGGQCQVFPVEKTSTSSQIQLIGRQDALEKNIRIVTSSTSPIIIESWVEVGAF